ncbi:MAG: RNA polymerase sigma factor [Bacteroidales bacterium]|nr:RNA polymerase sigma factor [Bacteroidales bacterium]
MESINSDRYYINLILSGNKEAFSSIVERHKDNVYNLALKICGNREDAEEVAQDSFIKVFRSLSSFKWKSGFATWLYRIVYNTSMTFVRKNKLDILRLEDFPVDSVDFIGGNVMEDEAEIEYMKILLSYAMQKLDHDDRAIITMHYYLDMSHTEICSVTGISRSNIKVRLFRARKKIQETIEKNILKERRYEKV